MLNCLLELAVVLFKLSDVSYVVGRKVAEALIAQPGEGELCLRPE